MRKFLLFGLFLVFAVAAMYKSPFSAMVNLQKGKNLYSEGKIEQSLPYFERSLFADKKNILTRFYYALALSKANPTYSVQKKLYELSEYETLDEATKFAKSQIIYIKHQLMKGLENNYIYNAAMGNDIVRWNIRSFPLSVYIEEQNNIPPYYSEMIKEALKQWSSKTNFVKFNITKDKTKANIVITFKDIGSDVCNPDGSCKYIIGYTEPDISNDKILKHMNLTFYKTNPRKENFTADEIFNTAQHEIGHTLGIMGHSDSPADIMYARSDVLAYDYAITAVKNISARDLRTLVLLYRIEPTISDKEVKEENLYYAPLIIGKEDIVLQKKLDEYANYIKNYPELATGYINISSVYVDMGEYDSALKNLNKAKEYAKSTDEKYVIEYDFAIIYYNKQELQKALDHALKAKEIKPSENSDDLITDIQKLMKK